MNIEPSKWGSSTWKFLHCVTFTYPDNPSQKIKNEAKVFFDSLQFLLPCYKCRVNLSNHYKTRPLTDEILSSRHLLINWLIDIHNDVNISLGKPIMTYENVVKEYFGHKGSNSWSNRLIVVFLIMVVLITIIILVKKY